MRELPSPPIGAKLKLDHPLARGLMGAWLFNEGGGTKVHDYSEQGKTGTLIDTPTWVGDGLDFSDDAVDIGAKAYNGVSAEMTLIFLVRPDSYTTFPRLIDKYPGPSISIGSDPYPVRFYGTIGGTSRDDQWFGVNITFGTWVTIAVRLGSGFQECYRNGKLSASALNFGPYSGAYSDGGATVAYLGNKASDKARDYDGVMKYAYLYNRALSAEEIATLSAFPYAMFEEESPYQIWRTAVGGYTIVAEPGSYALSGQAANALFGRKIAADAGSHVLSGQDVSTLFGRKIQAEVGGYVLSGQDIALLRAARIGIEPGGYVLTGQESGLLRAARIGMDGGTYTLSGQVAEVLFDRLISLDAGAYVLTGQDVSLIYLAGYTLIAEAGSYTLVGQAAALLKGHGLPLEAGAYVFTGQGAGVLLGRRLAAETGSHVIVGQAADLLRDGRLAAEAGSFILIGADSGLVYSGVVPPIVIGRRQAAQGVPRRGPQGIAKRAAEAARRTN